MESGRYRRCWFVTGLFVLLMIVGMGGLFAQDSAALDARVERLLSRMTIEEKSAK